MSEMGGGWHKKGRIPLPKMKKVVTGNKVSYKEMISNRTLGEFSEGEKDG